jgi:hypothetical protein
MSSKLKAVEDCVNGYLLETEKHSYVINLHIECSSLRRTIFLCILMFSVELYFIFSIC